MRTSIAGFLWLVLTTSCSSGNGGSSAPVDGAIRDSSVSSDTALDGNDDAAEPDCSEPVEDRPPGAVCVHDVRGLVVQEADGKTPVAGKVVSVCGNVCYYGGTNGAGNFSTHVGHYISIVQYQVLIHGRPDRASLYVKLPAPNSDGDIVFATPIVVPSYDSMGPPLPEDDAPGGKLTAGDVTLTVPDGIEYDLDPEDVALGSDGRLLRSVRWTSATLPSFVAGSDVAALYALAPFSVRFCKSRPCPDAAENPTRIPVSLKNTTSLPAGTAVEFFILGTDLYSVPRNAGVLVVQATGKVSADGKTIDTDAGQGINELSLIGVRAKK